MIRYIEADGNTLECYIDGKCVGFITTYTDGPASFVPIGGYGLEAGVLKEIAGRLDSFLTRHITATD